MSGFSLSRWFRSTKKARSGRKPAQCFHPGLEALEDRQLLSSFFVSLLGNDASAGTSLATPWRSIDRVNRQGLKSGDSIWFSGGATFTGNLQVNGLGIKVGSYGNGRATIDAGNGDGITLNDPQNVDISNINLKGNCFNGSRFVDGNNVGMGIRVNNSRGSILNNLRIDKVDACGFGIVGVGMYSRPWNFFSCPVNNVSITNSTLHDNGLGGLFIDCGAIRGSKVYVDHVQANHNAGAINGIDGITPGLSGFGIIVSGVDDVVIQHCVALDNGWRPGHVGGCGGIGAQNDQRALLQYNEAGRNHNGIIHQASGPDLAGDGDGVYLANSSNSVMQFNYAHDNDGAGLMLLADCAKYYANNVIRFNISENDGLEALSFPMTYGGLWIGGSTLINAQVYHNTVYSRFAPALWLNGGDGSSVKIVNNIFTVDGAAPVVKSNGVTSPGWKLYGNDYWNYQPTNFRISWWMDQNYQRSFGKEDLWSQATRQEILNGRHVGLQVDPRLTRPGRGGTIGNPDRLGSLMTYNLLSNSPLNGKALDPVQFGIEVNKTAFVLGETGNLYALTTRGPSLQSSGVGAPWTLFSRNTFQWTALGGNQKSFVIDIRAGMKRIFSLGLNGVVYQYSLANGTWTTLSVANVKSIVLGSNGDLFALATGGNVFRYNGSPLSWTAVSEANVKTIVMTPNGDLFALATGGNVFRYNGSPLSWTAISAANVTSIVTAPNGNLIALATDGNFFQYELSPMLWTVIQGPKGGSINLALDGNLYSRTSDGRLLRYSGTSWVPVA